MDKGMLKQAQELQAKLIKAQDELEHATVEASSGGGAVTVVVTGQQAIRSIKISPEVVDPDDVELLEDMILAALNEAMEKARGLAAKRLGSLTGGLKIPGL
ncbi:MAG: Nucleoid-associated protein [Chloroflexi bacterium]|nr:Nucleoid-associated protein [Chloroflexota bacterium]MBT9165667.1 Nucleoid-associated protein [Chloroflexota bacterium]